MERLARAIERVRETYRTLHQDGGSGQDSGEGTDLSLGARVEKCSQKGARRTGTGQTLPLKVVIFQAMHPVLRFQGHRFPVRPS